jgi:hypothetical protein
MGLECRHADEKNRGPKQPQPVPRHERTSGASRVATHPALERHYSIDEVAALWQLSRQTVRRVFDDEAGGIALWPWRLIPSAWLSNSAHPRERRGPSPRPTPRLTRRCADSRFDVAKPGMKLSRLRSHPLTNVVDGFNDSTAALGNVIATGARGGSFSSTSTLPRLRDRLGKLRSQLLPIGFGARADVPTLADEHGQQALFLFRMCIWWS